VGAISLLSIVPASRLPRYVPRELSADEILAEPGGDAMETDSRA